MKVRYRMIQSCSILGVWSKAGLYPADYSGSTFLAFLIVCRARGTGLCACQSHQEAKIGPTRILVVALAWRYVTKVIVLSPPPGRNGGEKRATFTLRSHHPRVTKGEP